MLWFVKDSSTNGTWVNAERVQRGMSMVIHRGDHLKLSCGALEEVLEYAFETEDHADTTAKRKVKNQWIFRAGN